MRQTECPLWNNINSISDDDVDVDVKVQTEVQVSREEEANIFELIK